MPLALPDDTFLADVASALESARMVAEVWDAGWRLAYATTDYLSSAAGPRAAEGLGVEEVGIGEHVFSQRTFDLRSGWPGGPDHQGLLDAAEATGPYVLWDTPGGLESLRPAIAGAHFERLATMVAREPPASWTLPVRVRFGAATTPLTGWYLRLHDASGRFAGTVGVFLPALPGSVLGMLALGDPRLFGRMFSLIQPRRTAAAVLFGDLESSTQLSRRLPTQRYFELMRRLARGIDERIVEAGGIVGKHVGDGITAFFAVEPGQSESEVAAACVRCISGAREVAARAASRSGLEPADVVMRFGAHWGTSLFIGRLMTSGRMEATAFGDEVNEAARIEACASGGLALASKALLERLGDHDARAVGIDPAAVTYATLSEFPTAPEKARRDAPSLSVCSI